MEPILVFNVENQKVSRMDSFHPVQGSRNYLYAEFRFLTSDWNGHKTKTAVFKGAEEAISVVLSDDGRCLVPWEVLRKDSFTVSVFAGDLITTNKSVVKVYRSGYESGRDVKDPTPSVYEQIMGTFDDAKACTAEQAQIAVNAADDAKASRQAAESAKTAAESAANRAVAAAKDVEASKTQALAEIRQKESDAIGEIESARDVGVQAINSAKVSAQKEIAGQIAAIHEAGAKTLTAVHDAGDKWLRDINAAGNSHADAINTAGGAQVQSINTAGETQLSSIETASTAAQTAIGTAKEDAVSAVQMEGETQIENIRQSAADYESLAIKEAVQGESILIEDSAKWPLKGLKLFGNSTQDGTPSPENPVPIVSAGDGGQIDVGVYGENLAAQDFLYGVETGQPFGGKVFNYNTGDFSAEGLLEIPAYGKERTMSYFAEHISGYSIYLGLFDERLELVKKQPFCTTETKENHVLTIGSNVKYIVVGSSNVISNICKVDNLFIGIGENFTYEPYTRQCLPCHTPNGLPGIPVSSGGNYTDESGQQWVCDEVDFGRGVYVRRVKKVVLDGSESWQKRGVVIADTYQTKVADFDFNNASIDVPAISDIYPYKNNVTTGTFYVMGHGYVSVAYSDYGTSTVEQFKNFLNENNMTVLAKANSVQEIPLPDSVLTAYAALHANYPTTTVLNDSGAGIVVEYVADTRNYIGKLLGAAEQRIAALETNAIGG